MIHPACLQTSWVYGNQCYEIILLLATNHLTLTMLVTYKKVMVHVFLLNFSASNRLVNRCSCFVIGISLLLIISKVFKQVFGWSKDLRDMFFLECCNDKHTYSSIPFHRKQLNQDLHRQQRTRYQILNLLPNFEKGGLARMSSFRGGLLRGGCNFYIRNKLKSEIFYDKKSL